MLFTGDTKTRMWEEVETEWQEKMFQKNPNEKKV